MSAFVLFIHDIRQGFLIIRQWIIGHGDTIQGITSCVALYFTYKLFVFTRKKPQINLQYQNGKRILKNVGDLSLRNATIILIDIGLAEGWRGFDGFYNVKESMEKNCQLLKNKAINLFDIGIGQSIEINRIFTDIDMDIGLSLFHDKEKIKTMYFIYQEQESQAMQEMREQQKLTQEEIEKEIAEYNFHREEEENDIKSFFSSISFLKVRVKGVGYDQMIKYLR